jgi:hypothetical protein
MSHSKVLGAVYLATCTHGSAEGKTRESLPIPLRPEENETL